MGARPPTTGNPWLVPVTTFSTSSKRTRNPAQLDASASPRSDGPSMHLIWPPPLSFTATGPTVALAPDIEILLQYAPSPRYANIRSRYHTLLLLSAATTRANSSSTMLHEVHVSVADQSEALNVHTCYNYSLTVQDTAATISACSIFGAAYGLEALVQLAGSDGMLPGRVAVHDAPRYAWRGLMIDAGRRFFPVPLVRNLLDTMAAIKVGKIARTAQSSHPSPC